MTDRSTADTTADDSSTDRDDKRYAVPSGVEPGVGVIEAVADAVDERPTALPPLQESVDVDAMNALLAEGDAVVLTIRYADHVIVVDGDGTITVGQ